MGDRVRSETRGPVCTVTLADVANRNALGDALVAELMAAFDAAEADPAVRVIVLTNDGPVFCAGADLRGSAGATSDAAATPPAAALFARFATSSTPYVGRIAGHCVAGGMGLAAAMDVSVAVDTAKMGFTEVRVGVAPAIISVVCLPKMRPADAREAFLRGNRFLAPEAVRLGLINAAVPVEQLDAAVADVVADLLAGGPEALAATKALLATVPGLDPADAFAWTADLSARLFAGAEATAGMAAYLAKRPAPWTVDPTA